MGGLKKGYLHNPFLFLLAGILLLGTVTHFYMVWTAPVSMSDEPQLVEIESGWGIKQVGQRLEEKKLIRSGKLFSIIARVNGGKIKAGEYQLYSNLSSWQILNILQEGKTYLHKITIPEGYSLRQIAHLLETNNLASSQEFIKIATNEALIQDLLGFKATSLEGYLFPETYHFARGSSTEFIIRAMTGRFNEIFTKEFQEQALKLGLNKHQITTLASLVEKETAIETERPLISSVYHNRLKKGIRLQCDPTVIYALEQLGDFDGNIRREDLQLDSPYNTYRYKGLPPGPIANPGQAAIQAALYPVKSDYIYFVSRNDGTHKFSTSLKEHNNAVYKYQKRRNTRRH